MTDIPEWAKPLVAARERGATLQLNIARVWKDENPVGGFAFIFQPNEYRIKPGTDPGERTANPLIWGASIPGSEPVPVRDDYVPLTECEVSAFYRSGSSTRCCIEVAHRAGWERRRTP